MTSTRKFLYAAVTVAAVGVMIEGASRLVWWRLERRSLDRSIPGRQILKNDAINFMKIADSTYGYRLRNNFKMPGLTINSEGFHQADEIPVIKPESTLRVLCLGESTTFGTNDESNYPAFLGRLLRQSAKGYRSYEVINAGVPGWVSDQVAIRVHHQLARFKPDVVVLYVGWNDFQGFDPTAAPPKVSAFEVMYGGNIWKQYATGALRSVALLSAVYQHFHPPPVPVNAPNPGKGSPEMQYRFLLRNLSQIVQDLRTENPASRIFVCTLVGLWPQGSAEHWAQISATVPWWITADHLTPAISARYVAELNGTLIAFGQTHNLDLIDMASAFEDMDRQRLQFDWAHMYPDGYELMAWNILSALYRAGIVHGDMGPRPEQLMSGYRLPAAAGKLANR